MTLNKFTLADWFDYKDWFCQSSYNGRHPRKLNKLNLWLQIFDEYIFKVHSKIFQRVFQKYIDKGASKLKIFRFF